MLQFANVTAVTDVVDEGVGSVCVDLIRTLAGVAVVDTVLGQIGLRSIDLSHVLCYLHHESVNKRVVVLMIAYV